MTPTQASAPASKLSEVTIAAAVVEIAERRELESHGEELGELLQQRRPTDLGDALALAIYAGRRDR